MRVQTAVQCARTQPRTQTALLSAAEGQRSLAALLPRRLCATHCTRRQLLYKNRAFCRHALRWVDTCVPPARPASVQPVMHKQLQAELFTCASTAPTTVSAPRAFAHIVSRHWRHHQVQQRAQRQPPRPPAQLPAPWLGRSAAITRRLGRLAGSRAGSAARRVCARVEHRQRHVLAIRHHDDRRRLHVRRRSSCRATNLASRPAAAAAPATAPATAYVRVRTSCCWRCCCFCWRCCAAFRRVCCTCGCVLLLVGWRQRPVRAAAAVTAAAAAITTAHSQHPQLHACLKARNRLGSELTSALQRRCVAGRRGRLQGPAAGGVGARGAARDAPAPAGVALQQAQRKAAHEDCDGYEQVPILIPAQHAGCRRWC